MWVELYSQYYIHESSFTQNTIHRSNFFDILTIHICTVHCSYGVGFFLFSKFLPMLGPKYRF